MSYYDIVVTVEPKRNALRQAKEDLANANTKLAEVQDRHSRLALVHFDPQSRLRNNIVGSIVLTCSQNNT